MKPILPWLLGLALGCRERVDLPEVPILGGSPEQREVVRLGLEAFDTWVGPGRLQLTEVVIEPLEEPFDGWFSRNKKHVRIDSALPLNYVVGVLQHELCHALDFAEGLLDTPQPAFDTFGDYLFDQDADFKDHRENARGRRSEALAQTCELGPLGAALLSSPCPGEDALGTELARWTSQSVWREFELPQPWPALGPPHATWEAPDQEPLSSFGATPTDQPGALLLALAYSDHHSQVAVDLHTAEYLPGSFSPRLSDSQPPPGLPGLGWPEGPGATILEFPLRDLDGPWAPRLLASDGGPWAPVGDGCIEQQQGQLFTADARIWYAWSEGARIHWTPVLPDEL